MSKPNKKCCKQEGCTKEFCKKSKKGDLKPEWSCPPRSKKDGDAPKKKCCG